MFIAYIRLLNEVWVTIFPQTKKEDNIFLKTFNIAYSHI